MYWFYFEPKSDLYSNSLFVEIDSEMSAKKFLTEERKFDLFDYRAPIKFNTFDYATYYLRGCAFDFPGGVLRISEKQRPGSTFKYQTLEEFEKRKDVYIFKQTAT